ncbi:MAG: hypothetical protein ACJ78X_12825, partial [Myxococcales bacterium]
CSLALRMRGRCTQVFRRHACELPQEHKASAFERALNALEHLAKADPDRYELLIAGLRPKQRDTASLG